MLTLNFLIVTTQTQPQPSITKVRFNKKVTLQTTPPTNHTQTQRSDEHLLTTIKVQEDSYSQGVFPHGTAGSFRRNF